ISRTFANVRYALPLRSSDLPIAGASRGTISADAFVEAASERYFGFVRKLNWPSFAASRVFTPVISISPSPSRTQERDSASSRSFIVDINSVVRTLVRLLKDRLFLHKRNEK